MKMKGNRKETRTGKNKITGKERSITARTISDDNKG